VKKVHAHCRGVVMHDMLTRARLTKGTKHEIDILIFLNIRTLNMFAFVERISKNELPDIFLGNRAFGAGMHKCANLT
jgi:hypothetical protein